MDCGGDDCRVGENIKVQHCSGSSVVQRFFADNGTIRPTIAPSLCFTIMGYGTAQDTDGKTITTPIQLQSCVADDQNQQFVSRPRVGTGGFELSPVDRPDRCLAQLHHPKSSEKIFPRRCTSAQADTTGAWIKI